MSQEPTYVGLDVSKERIDIAARPTDKSWSVSYDSAGVDDLHRGGVTGHGNAHIGAEPMRAGARLWLDVRVRVALDLTVLVDCACSGASHRFDAGDSRTHRPSRRAGSRAAGISPTCESAAYLAAQGRPSLKGKE